MSDHRRTSDPSQGLYDYCWYPVREAVAEAPTLNDDCWHFFNHAVCAHIIYFKQCLIDMQVLFSIVELTFDCFLPFADVAHVDGEESEVRSAVCE